MRYLFRREGAAVLPEAGTALRLRLADAADPAALLPRELAFVGGAETIGPGLVIGEAKVRSYFAKLCPSAKTITSSLQCSVVFLSSSFTSSLLLSSSRVFLRVFSCHCLRKRKRR